MEPGGDGNMLQPPRSTNTERSCSLTWGQSHRAQVRSQAGPGAGMALSATPTHFLTRIPPHLFRVVMLRRLRLPLPLSLHTCRCGRHVNKFGYHRTSCARAGVLGRRGFALESATARVTTNIMVRDLDLGEPRAADGRRLEVVVDALVSGMCQLAVDATVVCTLHCDGSPHRGAENMDGVVLERARRRKERTYPELVVVGPRRRARLVVLGIEVGGRMSTETTSFLSQLAKARSRQETALLRRRVEQVWRMRWGAILACATARAVATSLLNLCTAHGADGDTPPAHEVEGAPQVCWPGPVTRESCEHASQVLTFVSTDFIPSFSVPKKNMRHAEPHAQRRCTCQGRTWGARRPSDASVILHCNPCDIG